MLKLQRKWSNGSLKTPELNFHSLHWSIFFVFFLLLASFDFTINHHHHRHSEKFRFSSLSLSVCNDSFVWWLTKEDTFKALEQINRISTKKTNFVWSISICLFTGNLIRRLNEICLMQCFISLVPFFLSSTISNKLWSVLILEHFLRYPIKLNHKNDLRDTFHDWKRKRNRSFLKWNTWTFFWSHSFLFTKQSIGIKILRKRQSVIDSNRCSWPLTNKSSRFVHILSLQCLYTWRTIYRRSKVLVAKNN